MTINMGLNSAEKWKKWEINHPERAKYYDSAEYARKWRSSHKESCQIAQQKYRKNHMAELVKRNRDRIRKTKHQVFELLGNKCVKCGFSDPRALQIDHIQAIGNATKRKRTRGSSLNGYGLILEAIRSGKPHNYQLLCANCNWIKRWEKGEHDKSQNFINPFS